ncbi:MAG: hypothetical protein ACP5O0_02130 [Acidimicrobiales bacterium]
MRHLARRALALASTAQSNHLIDQAGCHNRPHVERCQSTSPNGYSELAVYFIDQGATITDRFYVVHQGSLVESFESSTTVVGRHTVEMMLRLAVARGSG